MPTWYPSTDWKGLAADVLTEAGIETDGRLTRVPFRTRDGSTAFCKIFDPRSGRSWYDPSPVTLTPFGLDAIPPRRSCFARYCALVVCEGESDACAFRDAFGLRTDARAVAYFALAAPGARTWRAEWTEYLGPFARVYVAGDGDAAGAAMNRAVVASFPRARILRIPAGDDVRGLLQRDPRALDPLLDDADALERLDQAITAGDFHAFQRAASRRAA